MSELYTIIYFDIGDMEFVNLRKIIFTEPKDEMNRNEYSFQGGAPMSKSVIV